MGMPGGYNPFWYPAVSTPSFGWTLVLASTRLIDRSWLPPPCNRPVSRDTTSRAATWESGSTMSRTFDAVGVTWTTWPTSPLAATTGSFTLTSSCDPLSIVTDHAKLETPLATTSAPGVCMTDRRVDAML